MAITWVEDNQSRSATIARLGRKAQSTYVKSWKLFGSTNDLEVHADVNQTLTLSALYWDYPGNPEMRLQAESYSLEYLGDDAWQLQVNYVKEGAEDPEQPDPLRRSRSFDTSGGTQHITQAPKGGVRNGSTASTAVERRYGAGAPDMNGAIGVDGDNVAGVDIVVPALQWTETYDVPAAYMTANYIKTVSALTGTVNNATFRSFAAGEVLFMGCSGSQEWDEQKGDGPWNLSYKFVANSNVTNQTIGDITGIEKKGHEYLWIRYESVLDGPATTEFKKPKFVYVNRVYRDADFSQLGIGVA